MSINIQIYISEIRCIRCAYIYIFPYIYIHTIFKHTFYMYIHESDPYHHPTGSNTPIGKLRSSLKFEGVPGGGFVSESLKPVSLMHGFSIMLHESPWGTAVG